MTFGCSWAPLCFLVFFNMICSQKPKPKPGCTRLGTVSQRRVVLVRQMPLRGDVSLPTCSAILCLALFWSCSSRCSSVVHVSRGIPSPFSSRMKAPAKHVLEFLLQTHVSPWPLAACRAVPAAPGCCACPQHSAVATTPSLSVLWFSGHLQFSPAKGLGMWTPLVCFSRQRNEKISCLELSWAVTHVCYLLWCSLRFSDPGPKPGCC